MVYFATSLNTRKLSTKSSKGLIQKIYKGIYIDKIEDIKTNISAIIDKLGIESGILFYKSAIEYDSNITEDTIYILSKTTNKTIVLGNNNFKIILLKMSPKFNIKTRELITAVKNEKLLIPKKEYGYLLNFIKSSVFSKRSNKDLVCDLIIQDILNSFKDIEHKDIYLNSIKQYATSIDMLDEYELFNNYFEEYYKAHYKDFDTKRIEMFTNLVSQLLITPPEHYKKTNRNILFYEAYFSNYIEGTEFEVIEAENIVFNTKYKYERHQDGHDIKRTYEIVSDIYYNPMIFNNFQEFIKTLKDTHKRLMGHRSDQILVGEFKQKVNVSGSMRFVLPSLVNKTLEEGFKIYNKLYDPFHKAIFIHLLIAEVDPFDDGNGRLSRIFMNNELSCASFSHIVIPTVFRDDYITALKGFSHQGNSKPIISALIKAYKITNSINWDDNRVDINAMLYKNSGFEKDTNSIWGISPNTINKEEDNLLKI